VQFESALEEALPADIPQRDQLIEKAGLHLQLILAANEYMNLTRITDPREAAVKHIFDSVAAWAFFQTAHKVLDVGSGAGFPGIPLAVVLPGTRFVLAESIQKKARFLDSTVESLQLPNVSVFPDRAETVALAQRPDIITARAVAPLERLLDLLGKCLTNGTRMLLFKGPDVEGEIRDLGKKKYSVEIVYRYELPFELGARTIVQVQKLK
jgi:16S rRNA (guanine527-N7)-methyltransferase